MEWCKCVKTFSSIVEITGVKFCPFCGVPRPKEEKKLWEILKNVFTERYRNAKNSDYQLVEEFYTAEAQATIEAVIKVYEGWVISNFPGERFPDYLKEKLL